MKIPKYFQPSVFKFLGIMKSVGKVKPVNSDELYKYLRSLQRIILEKDIRPLFLIFQIVVPTNLCNFLNITVIVSLISVKKNYSRVIVDMVTF